MSSLSRFATQTRHRTSSPTFCIHHTPTQLSKRTRRYIDCERRDHQFKFNIFRPCRLRAKVGKAHCGCSDVVEKLLKKGINELFSADSFCGTVLNLMVDALDETVCAATTAGLATSFCAQALTKIPGQRSAIGPALRPVCLAAVDMVKSMTGFSIDEWYNVSHRCWTISCFFFIFFAEL